MQAGTAQVRLTADIADFAAKMQQARRTTDTTANAMQSAFSGLGAQLAGAFSLGAMAAFIKSVNDGVDALNDVADATGASIENISALEDIAARTGTSFDTVGQSLIKLNLALQSAKPNSDAETAIKALGLSVADLKAMDPAEAFMVIARAMNGFAGDANLARLSQELFGKSLREIAPLLKDAAEKGALNATVTTQQAQEAEKFNKQLFEMHKNVTDLSRSIAGPLIQVFNSLIAKQNQLRDQGKFGLFSSVNSIEAAYQARKDANYTGSWYEGNAGRGSLNPDLVKPSVGDPFGAKPTDPKKHGLTDAEKAALKAAEELRQAHRDLTMQLGLDVEKANQQWQDQLAKLVGDTPSGKLEQQRKDMLLLTEAYQLFIDTNGAAGISEQQYLESVTARLDLTEEKIIQSTEKADHMNYVFTNAFKGMEDALVGFVQTGKLSFSGLIDSFIADLLRYQIQQSITLPLMGMLSNGGGGLMGLLGITRAGSNPAGYAGTLNNPSAYVATFAGGGFTGYGSRSGGIDGLGGFPAILHPNETVVDHTRGASAGQSITINIGAPVIGSVASQADVVAGMQVVRQQILGQLSRNNSYGGIPA